MNDRVYQMLTDVHLIAELAATTRAEMVERVRDIFDQEMFDGTWRWLLELFDKEIAKYRQGLALAELGNQIN